MAKSVGSLVLVLENQGPNPGPALCDPGQGSRFCESQFLCSGSGRIPSSQDIGKIKYRNACKTFKIMLST